MRWLVGLVFFVAVAVLLLGNVGLGVALYAIGLVLLARMRWSHG